MKKIYFLFKLLFCCTFFFTETNAAILTVSNDVNNPAQFTSIQMAHDSASVGDTLYIYGSETVYGSVNVFKEITFIGNGYAPTSMNNNNDFSTRITNIDLTNNVGAGTSASNSSFKSIEVTNRIRHNTFSIVNGITIDRCKINEIYTANYVNDNWLITNSEIWMCDMENMTNTVFSNCIFGWRLILANTTNTVLIAQSLISTPNVIKYEGVIFQNNIFYGIDFSATANFSYCTFTNNLTFDDGTASPLPIGVNNNTGANNIEDSDPMFVTFDEVAGCGSSCIDNEDYHLQSGSPAIGAGLGGNDLGIYDGNYPWPDASGYTGMPPIPEVTSFNIINSVVIPGQKVHFDAEAETRN